jgi:hypothetical protein
VHHHKWNNLARRLRHRLYSWRETSQTLTMPIEPFEREMYLNCDKGNCVINRTIFMPTTYLLSLLNVRGMGIVSNALVEPVARRTDNKRERAASMVVGRKNPGHCTAVDFMTWARRRRLSVYGRVSRISRVSRQKGFRFAMIVAGVGASA